MPASGPFRVLRIRTFRLFFLAQAGSDIGSALATVGFAFAVLDLRGSAADLGLVMAARVAPMLLATLVGSVWTDRLAREKVLIWTRLASGAAQCATAVLLLTGTAELVTLTVLSFVVGAAGVVWAPAAGAVIPTLVPPEQLHAANALSRLAGNTIAVAGAALGGLLAAVIDPAWTLMIDGITFFASAALLCLLPVNRGHAADGARHFGRDLREGWTEFLRQDWLWPVVLQFAVVNIAWTGAFMLIGPSVAVERLGGPAAWGVILGAHAVGAVVGGVIALRHTPRRPMLTGVLCVLPLAGPLLAVALDAGTAAVAVACFAAGVFLEIFEVQYAVTLQTHVPADKLARVSGIDGLASFGVLPLGYVLAGPMVMAVGAGPASAVFGAAIVVATAVTAAAPGVRRVTAQRVGG
jgi:MFS family permease